METSPRGGGDVTMDEQATEYLESLAKLREDPANPGALLALAVLYAEEGHRACALHYLRKAEFLEPRLPGLRKLRRRLDQWCLSNGGPLPNVEH